MPEVHFLFVSDSSDLWTSGISRTEATEGEKDCAANAIIPAEDGSH